MFKAVRFFQWISNELSNIKPHIINASQSVTVDNFVYKDDQVIAWLYINGA